MIYRCIFVKVLVKKERIIMIDSIVENPELLKSTTQTYELCLSVVMKNGNAIEYVNPEFRTKEMFMTAVMNDPKSLFYIYDENEQFLELCLAAVCRYGLSIAFVAPKYRTYEICLAAVMNNGNALRYSHLSSHGPQFGLTDVQYKKICLFAVMQNKKAIQYIDKEFKTPEIMKLIKNNAN